MSVPACDHRCEAEPTATEPILSNWCFNLISDIALRHDGHMYLTLIPAHSENKLKQ